MVRILFPSPIMKVTRERETEVSAGTLGEVLDKLIEKYGEPFREIIFEASGEINRYINFYIKGSDVSGPSNMATRLRDGDEVAILIIIGGG